MGGALLTLAVLALAGLAYIYSGLYNIAATAGHGAAVRWILETGQRNSVQAHAQSVGEPPPFGAEQVRRGAEHYASTCAVCHGGPGVERGALGKGLTPRPPDLARAAGQWTERELYWIVKNGIKFTGMPAFGPTHSHEELWAMIAFVKRLPGMTPEQYAAFAAQTKAAGHQH